MCCVLSAVEVVNVMKAAFGRVGRVDGLLRRRDTDGSPTSGGGGGGGQV